jgi:iron transport multicopper oxidase
MTVVELDGGYTKATEVTTMVVGAAMRYGVLVTAKETTTENFDFSAWVDISMFRTPFQGNPVAHATLVYDKKNAKPEQRTPQVLSTTILPPSDDLTVLPLDDEPILGPVTKQIVLDFGFQKINGVQRAIINDVTYLPPK